MAATLDVSLENVNGVFDQIKDLYGQEKTIRAFRIWEAFQQVYNGADQESETYKAAKTVVDENTKLIARICAEANCVLAFLHELESDVGWELARKDEGVTTHSKQVPDSPLYSVKMKGVINSPLFDVLACVNEIDFYKKWIPTCTESNILHHISDFKKIVQLKIVAPSPINWVVPSREMFMYGFGVDMMDDNKMAAMAKTPTPQEWEDFKAEFNFSQPAGSGCVQMNCHLAGLLLEPIDETHTRVSVLSNCDPKVILPYWVLNVATKKLAHLVFTFLRKQAANLDDEYRARIESGTSVYESIRKMITKTPETSALSGDAKLEESHD